MVLYGKQILFPLLSLSDYSYNILRNTPQKTFERSDSCLERKYPRAERRYLSITQSSVENFKNTHSLCPISGLTKQLSNQ